MGSGVFVLRYARLLYLAPGLSFPRSPFLFCLSYPQLTHSTLHRRHGSFPACFLRCPRVFLSTVVVKVGFGNFRSRLPLGFHAWIPLLESTGGGFRTAVSFAGVARDAIRPYLVCGFFYFHFPSCLLLSAGKTLLSAFPCLPLTSREERVSDLV